MKKSTTENSRLDQVVAEAQRNRDAREQGYRERALRMYPWICGRCSREFDRSNLQELTVHHRDHDHDNNPEDGSNWELLCVYCHDNEHAKYLEPVTDSGVSTPETTPTSTHKPFADLAKLLKK